MIEKGVFADQRPARRSPGPCSAELADPADSAASVYTPCPTCSSKTSAPTTATAPPELRAGRRMHRQRLAEAVGAISAAQARRDTAPIICVVPNGAAR